MRMKWLCLICGMLLFSRLIAQNDNTNTVLTDLKVEELAKAENWKIIEQTALRSSDALFKKIVENKALFVEVNGEEKVNRKLSEVFVGDLTEYVLGEKGYEPAVLLPLYPMLMKARLSQNDLAQVMYKLAAYRGKENYVSMVQVLTDQSSVLGEERIGRLNLSLDKCKGLSEASRKALQEYFTLQLQKYPQNEEYGKLAERFKHPEGIIFEGGTYSDWMAKAAKEDKLVFIDTYTTWCGPCKKMAENVFPEKSVGDFFNKHFICAKMDMEEGEGPGFRKKFNITAFPTFVLVDKNGEVVFNIVGYRNGPAFIDAFQKALEEINKKKN